MHFISLLVVMFKLDSDGKNHSGYEIHPPPLQVPVLISHEEKQRGREINVLSLG